MHRLQTVLLAAIAAFGFAAGALAADFPLNAPPALPVASWAGFYIGLNAGAAWTQQNVKTAPGGSLVSNPFVGSLGWGQDLSNTSTDFTGGGQIGVNFQSNRFVMGIETDFQSLGASFTNNSVFSSSDTSGTSVVISSISSKTPWFGTVRGRFGYTPDPKLMVYLTGGFAYGHKNITANVSPTVNGGLFEVFQFNVSQTTTGYAVGAGAEYRLSDHWSIKAEYLHVDLNGKGAGVAASIVGGNAFPTDVMNLRYHDRIDVVRGGLNYKL